jgi:hypothetical protein
MHETQAPAGLFVERDLAAERDPVDRAGYTRRGVDQLVLPGSGRQRDRDGAAQQAIVIGVGLGLALGGR